MMPMTHRLPSSKGSISRVSPAALQQVRTTRSSGAAASTSSLLLRRRCRSGGVAAAATTTGDQQQPGQQQKQQQQQPLLGLKEWAVTNAALGAGEQTVLLRKGGVREPRFTPPARRFLLFPTAFHSDGALLQPGAAERHAAAMALDPKGVEIIPIAQYVEVTGAWTLSDARVLEALAPLHVWGPGFLDARLKWRASQPLTLLELRAFRLEPPLALPRDDALFGCFSFVEMPGLAAADVEAALARKVAALDDATFAARQALLRERLAGLEGVEPLEIVTD